MQIDKKRTEQNQKLIEEIKKFGYPIEVFYQMQNWKINRNYKQLKLQFGTK